MDTKKTLLSLIKKNSRISITDLSAALSLSEDDVFKQLSELEDSGEIVQYTTVINDEIAFPQKIKALIELCVQPEQKLGYHSIAKRIVEHEHVVDLHLVSGHYDFLVVVEGNNLKEVSNFVSDLASIENVQKTATHVILNTYKKLGVKLDEPQQENRLAVSP